MKFILIVATLATVCSAAVVPDEKSIISSISSGISAASGLASSLSGSSSQNCQPAPVNVTALQNILPPTLAHIVTPENVQALQGVAKLAGLATSAATGNPVAIIKLVMFLASPENPIGPLYNMGKEILPQLTPSQIAQNFPSYDSVHDAVHTASDAVSNQVQSMGQQVANVFNKNPAPAASLVFV